MPSPRRGEIYWVNLDPTLGSEISKMRPAVIISNDIGNQYSQRVIVAPITSRRTQQIYPFEVRVEIGEGGLKESSKVLLDQIRTVDKSRLVRKLGKLKPNTMEGIDKAIRLSLDV